MTAATSNQSSTDELRDSLAQVQELLGRATPGEWKVFEDTIPWSLSNDRRGVHTQRRICTAWDHPQLRAPACITNLAFGVGLHDAATKGVQFVSMSREDGDAIIAAVNWLREHIPALLAMMEGRDGR